MDGAGRTTRDPGVRRDCGKHAFDDEAQDCPKNLEGAGTETTFTRVNEVIGCENEMVLVTWILTTDVRECVYCIHVPLRSESLYPGLVANVCDMRRQSDSPLQ